LAIQSFFSDHIANAVPFMFHHEVGGHANFALKALPMPVGRLCLTLSHAFVGAWLMHNGHETIGWKMHVN
jgi:hypothetical protein